MQVAATPKAPKQRQEESLKELRKWAVETEAEQQKPMENIEEWTKMISTKDEPIPIFIEMESKPYAPIKDWLHNGCQIPRQAIKGMCWINSNTLELITTQNLQAAVLKSLRRAKAEIVEMPQDIDLPKELHRLILCKNRTRDDVARAFYDVEIKKIKKHSPNVAPYIKHQKKTAPKPAEKTQATQPAEEATPMEVEA